MHTLPPTGNTAHTRPENNAFYPALDGLRAVAFLMVFGVHYLDLAWGSSGVSVFFVLSGFLITGILFDSRDAPFRVYNFYLRRALRIFPLFYGLFALLLVSTPFMHWHWNRFWLFWPLYLGNFLHFASPAAQVPHSALQLAADAHLSSTRFPRSELYLGHLWSLCVEEQFYLVWPAVVFWVRNRRRLIALCTTAVLLGPVLRFLLQDHAAPWLRHAEIGYSFTPCQIDAFLLGGLLALLWRGAHRDRLVVLARTVAFAGSAAVLGFLVFVLHGWQMGPRDYPSWSLTGGLVFVNTYAAAWIVCALQPGTWTYNVLRLRPLRWLGRISYGAYVFHDLPHGLYVHLVLHHAPLWLRTGPDFPFTVAALALVGTIGLAALSFRFLESPFLARKERWTKRPLPLPAQPPTAV